MPELEPLLIRLTDVLDAERSARDGDRLMDELDAERSAGDGSADANDAV